MKYERTASFKADYLRMTVPDRQLFKDAVRAVNDAAGEMQDPRLIQWPAKLRIKSVQSAPGVFEMTWSFAGPDGRATFEFVRVGEALALRWRRIGDHAVLLAP
jgi:hypothetical protein